MTEENSESGLKRRTVLSTMGTTAAIATGATGVSATEKKSSATKKAQKKYRDQSVRQQVFRKHAGKVISELAQRNLIQSASLSEFEIGTFHKQKTQLEAQGSNDGVAVTTFKTEDDNITELVMLAKDTSTHTIRVYVKPELKESYALIQAKQDGEKFAIDPSKESTELEATATCDDFYVCGDQCHNSCLVGGTYMDKAKEYSCYASGPDDRCSCYLEGTSCGGRDCWSSCGA